MRLTMLTLLAASIASQASAYISDEGHEYIQTCTKDSVVLKSVNPVVRQVGSGVGRDYWKGQEELRLGPKCNALNLIYGTGQWDWANGGFWVRFKDKEFAFPGQELFCPETIDLPDGMDCPLR